MARSSSGSIAVTGSIATDHLMHFPGRFAEQLVAEQLAHVSLSFLVDELVIRRGGIAANISFGMGQLGVRSVLVGSAGADFEEYRTWLEKAGADCDSVRISATAHTARFVCTTDDEMCQIASFYTGAMAESREIALAPIADRVGGFDVVLVCANDPDAMLRHSAECRERGYAFAADPSQQLARMPGADVRNLIEGAAYLFTNEYEHKLLESKTGLSDADILAQVGIRVTTLGSNGVSITGRDMDPIHVPVAIELAKHDPTGVGDGFRAGFFAASSWGLGLQRCAEVGSLVATYVIETVGTQEYAVEPLSFLRRLAESYGDASAAEVEPFLR
ncbi:MAG: carbohydrate kinase family protein [Mycobacteriales bacterium]